MDKNLDPRKEITIFEEAMKYVNYPMLFTDVFMNEYIPQLSEALINEKNEDAKNKLLTELSIHLANYSIIVYYLYGNKPELKETIDSNPELRRNFKKIKEWLDANNGKEYADNYIKMVLEEVSA